MFEIKYYSSKVLTSLQESGITLKGVMEKVEKA